MVEEPIHTKEQPRCASRGLVRELDGGQFNNTYLIELAKRGPVILRVAPSPERAVFWHERFLMRRELAMQTFLAPIAPLLPTILMTDFTHQVIERDYLFQRWIPGELWWDVQQETPCSSNRAESRDSAQSLQQHTQPRPTVPKMK